MATASLQSRGYLPVATASLCPASVLDCDLFIQRSGCPYAELYRGSTYPLEAADIEQLRQDGVDHLYIRSDDADAYRDYLCEHVLHDKSIPPAARMQALREVTRVAFQDALAASDCDRMVSVASEFGGDLASVVAERSIAFHELFTTLEHDYYTFTHVCNVSVYCTVLAHLLGTIDATALGEFAAAALLHDIGKRHIPAHILNKPGKLTDDEWDLIREHPTTGFREVATREDLTWAQLMVIYQHHERLDGSGYPCGIPAEEIHPWAKICAVVDVFDALTCHRPYRGPMPRKEVCDYLDKYAGVWFDASVVACWTGHVRSGL
jgi:HD-GYP domain-containing protein (c-di-GMP phosphodiesterase class II)